MRNSWTSKIILVLLATTCAWAQIDIKEPAKPEKQEVKEQEVALLALRKEVETLIRSLRAFRPDETLVALEESKMSEGLKSFFRGWAYHQQGDYKQASKQLKMVRKADLAGDTYFSSRLQELMRTADELADFTVVETANFSIRYQEGPDKVMLYFLPDMLEQVYARYSMLFDYHQEEKIIVELMPDHQLFSYASALTRKQIETTGTIALCVENRLVAMTPRRVAMGYYWPDVIAHEFVHYILTKLSRDRVPLWMQEGTAKYFESRWDAHGAAPLDESMESAVALALEKNSLLTVDQMMPSFAALPTAQLALQAYAQTTTMITYFCSLKGEEALRNLIVGLREKEGNMDAVMQEQVGQDFSGFEANWRIWLAQQGYRKSDTLAHNSVKLLDSDAPEEKLASVEAESKVQKKHVRLGDLLLERNRYVAALKEYQKILPEKGPASRQVVLRMITCYRQLDQHEQVIAFIDQNITDFDSDPTMLLHKAESQVALQRLDEAEPLLLRAIRYNPFNPGIYRLLLNIKEDDPEAARIYAEALKILTTPTAPATSDRKS